MVPVEKNTKIYNIENILFFQIHSRKVSSDHASLCSPWPSLHNSELSRNMVEHLEISKYGKNSASPQKNTLTKKRDKRPNDINFTIPNTCIKLSNIH